MKSFLSKLFALLFIASLAFSCVKKELENIAEELEETNNAKIENVQVEDN